MGIKLRSTAPSEVEWKLITLSAGSTLEICVKRPDFKDQVTSLAARTVIDQYRTRIARSVIDWRGVEDEQDPTQPVPFSTDALMQLIATYPQTLHQIDRAMMDVWYVLPEDLEKKLPQPPAPGGTTVPSETTTSTAS